MTKRSASHSALFNLRVSFGLVLGLTGPLLALLGSGAYSAQAQENYSVTTKSMDPLVPLVFDCSKIRELGIDKQENLRAGVTMIFCGEAKGGEPGESSSSSAFSKLVQSAMAPVTYGTTDVDLITGTETFPHITQSETFTTANPDDPTQIVVAYNDSRGFNANPMTGAGASVSTDGGNTFTRLTNANDQSPFPNCGSPVVLYNQPSQTWFTVWLDGGCTGLGGYKSTNPSDPDSWIHFCVHTGLDDRQSGWADNNPSSPFFGRMYVSWNDFGQPNANIVVTFSSDNGATWQSPVIVSAQSTFIRNVQITGDLATGDVYIAGMDEGGGGFPHQDTNLIFKSTDGGDTWTNSYTGPQFPGPGVTAVGYFACFSMAVATGATKVGVNLLLLTTLFIWFMPSMALAMILATFITSVLLMAA